MAVVTTVLWERASLSACSSRLGVLPWYRSQPRAPGRRQPKIPLAEAFASCLSFPTCPCTPLPVATVEPPARAASEARAPRRAAPCLHPLRRSSFAGAGIARALRGAVAARGSGEVSALPEQLCGDGSQRWRPAAGCLTNPSAAPGPLPAPAGRAGAWGAGGGPPPGAPTAAGTAGGVGGAAVPGVGGRPEVWDLAFQEQLCNETNPRPAVEAR